MIGIPAGNTPEYQAFSVSFWAALYSGLIYSLFTGVIVGLVIWGLQIIAEHRSQKQRVETQFYKLRESLKQINFEQNVHVITSATQSIPHAANEIVKALKGEPVEEWLKCLKKHRKFFEKLVDIQKQKLEFDRSAAQLDFHLNQFVRTYHGSRDVDAINDDSHKMHVIGRVLGSQYDQIKPWIDFGSKEGLEASYQAALDTTEVSTRIEPYLQQRNKLIHITDSIRENLFES